MKEPPIDPQILAALLDGRLDERQRAEVLERLAASDEAFEAYADAIAVMRELEAAGEPEAVGELEGGEREAGEPGGEPPPGIVQLEARRKVSRSARPWSWLALAAVLALLAAIPWAWLRTSSPAGPEDPGRYAALLADPEAGLPAGWDDRPWTVARAPGDPLTPEARAARLGARLVGLELAMRARDTAAARLAGEIVVLLEGIPGAGPVAAVYRELGQRAGEPSAELEPRLARGRTAVTRVADEEFVALGAWAEAARIAATRRDAGFFRARESRRTLERAGRLPGLGGQARAALDAVRTSLAADGPRDWSALERSLTALLRALGSPGASALR